MAFQLQSLAAPGIALFPDYINQQPLILGYQGALMGGSATVTSLPNDQLLFRIESKGLSISHRKDVIDLCFGQKVCTIRKQNWRMSETYYAEQQENGPRILEFTTHNHGMSGATYQLSFANAMDGGKPCRLDFKDETFPRPSPITLNGVPVALVERDLMSSKELWHIAPGMDMAIVVAFMVMFKDKKSHGARGW